MGSRLTIGERLAFIVATFIFWQGEVYSAIFFKISLEHLASIFPDERASWLRPRDYYGQSTATFQKQKSSVVVSISMFSAFTHTAAGIG